MSKAVPELRFPGFKGEWQTKPVGRLLKRASDPVRVEPEETYREIGVRSHGRGVFHKAPVSGAELGDKRVFHVIPDALVLNIVFAWEQAVAMTSSDEQGFIASHRFPMFLENAGQSYLPFIRQLLLTPRGKMLLEIASPGGAGRNKTLGQDAFLKLKTRVPERDEQKRIADLLDVTSRKVALLTDKKIALEDYKRGLMQRLFSRELRFTRDDGSAFPDWEEGKLVDVAEIVGGGTPESGKPAFWDGDITWFTPSEIKSKYLKDSERHISEMGLKSSSAKMLPVGTLVLSTRATVGEVGLATQPCTTNQGFQSLIIKTPHHNEFWYYWVAANKREFLRRSAGSTFLEIGKSEVSKIPALSPHPDEQHKIAAALSALDAKIDALSQKISEMEAFKKGLLQKLFV